MSEIETSKASGSLENLSQGKNQELKGNAPNELQKASGSVEELSDEELNAAIDNVGEMKSLDCRSECKYNTGERYKYANYGFSG